MKSSKNMYADIWGVHPKRTCQSMAGSTAEFETPRIIYKAIMTGVV